MYLPRRYPIRSIVTARLEKYRPETLAWLDRWSLQCDELVMGPWSTIDERRRLYTAAQFKGRVYQDSDCQVFVESCPKQAEAIATATGKRVICPATSQVWN
jgi:hypothetical protein